MPKLLEQASQGYRPYLIIIAIILGLSVFPALTLQPLDRDESRFMQATTQMFESHDFVRINFQDEARNKKPIGIHWLQSVSVAAFGGADARWPFPFRLVSIFGACLCAISTFLIGEKLFNRKIGLVSGVLLASSLLLSTEAHIAKTDASMAGFIALSFYALVKLRVEPAKLSNALLFWFAFGVAVLIKGPVPIMVIGFALLLLAIWEKGAPWLKPLLDWRGIAIFLALVLPWFFAIGWVTKGQFYIDALGQDLGQKLVGKQENKSIPPGLHTLISPIILWPSAFVIPAAIWAGFKLKTRPEVRFLLAWILPTWLVFELSPAKLAHYTLPAHAALVLLGVFALYNDAWRNKWVRWFGFGIAVFGTVIMTALPVLLAKDNAPSLINHSYAMAVIIGGLGFVGLALMFKANTKAFWAFLASSFAVSILVKGILLPQAPKLEVSRNVSEALLAQNIHPRLSQQGNLPALIGSGYQEPSLIFLTRSDSHLASIEDATANAAFGSPFAVEDRDWNVFLSAMANKGFMPIEKGAAIEGVNYSKGKKVKIHIGQLAAK